MPRLTSCKTVLSFLLFALLGACSAFSQTMSSSSKLLRQLDPLAEAADDPTQRSHYVSTILTLVGGDKLHDPFPSTFANRLAAAEERVRKGRQERVSELAVSMAFNRLAEIVNSPARVNVDRVHRLRMALSTEAPHLVTVSVSPTSCNPGEAIFLVYLLVANDGLVTPAPVRVPKDRQLPSVQLSAIPGNEKSVRALLSDFVQNHSQMEVLKYVEKVLSLLNL